MENPQKSLELTRGRYNHLVSALSALNNALRSGPPDQLPQWSTLQSHFNVLASTLDSLSQTLNQHFPRTQTNPAALVSYPLPSFPAHTQEILLSTLLNKKMNPTVEDWVSKALSDPPEDQDELWESAKDIVAEQQDERNWYDDLYTLEEREAGIEGIETGISEKKEEKKKDTGVVGLGLESMLRFMETGVLPADQPPLPMAVMPGAGPMKR